MRRVRVLLVEDEAAKREQIADQIRSFFGETLALETSESFGDATQKIFEHEYDLIVVDLLLPRRTGDAPTDVSQELVDNLMNSDMNRLSTTVAISRFEDVIDQRRSHFARAGILLIHYSNTDDWHGCLRICMQRVASNTLYDFVVVCALQEERAAFSQIAVDGFVIGELLSMGGLDAREITLGDLRGVCVLQPQMGLVDASIVATKALAAFSPRLICMSGICGGFSEQAKLGELIVSDFTWEHQAGKWRGSEFELRSYHENLDHDVRIVLSQLIEDDPRLTDLKMKDDVIDVPQVGAKLSPSVSGSAVIASDAYAARIAGQHGKVAAVDMEVFGIFRAAAMYGRPVICFAAKTVVDLAGEAKADDLHEAGALLSARFAVKAINRLLND